MDGEACKIGLLPFASPWFPLSPLVVSPWFLPLLVSPSPGFSLSWFLPLLVSPPPGFSFPGFSPPGFSPPWLLPSWFSPLPWFSPIPWFSPSWFYLLSSPGFSLPWFPLPWFLPLVFPHCFPSPPGFPLVSPGFPWFLLVSADFTLVSSFVLLFHLCFQLVSPWFPLGSSWFSLFSRSPQVPSGFSFSSGAARPRQGRRAVVRYLWNEVGGVGSAENG